MSLSEPSLAIPARPSPRTRPLDSPLIPAAVVGAFLAVLVSMALGFDHGSVAGLVTFGRQHVGDTAPPPGAPVNTPAGYDGQLYWIQAHDPLLLHRSTIARLTRAYPGYFLQRPVYPALAFVLALGQASLLPWTLLLINLGCVGALALIISRWARHNGRSVWWGAVAGLMPGVLLPVARDLSDLLAVTLTVAGFVVWRSGRRWTSACLLATATLTREPMVLAVAAIAGEAAGSVVFAGRCWRTTLGAAVRAWPVVLLPALAFGAWQLYASARVATVGIGHAQASGGAVASLSGYSAEWHDIVSHPLTLAWAWDGAYLALMVVASIVAVGLASRRLRAEAIAAALFAASLTVIVFGNWWGETRYSLPLFAMLLLTGIERRSRLALGTCLAVAGLGILIPVGVPAL